MVRKMNLYDKKIVKCSLCGGSMGEIDVKAKVIFPRCGNCANKKPPEKIPEKKLERDYDFPEKEVVNTLPS